MNAPEDHYTEAADPAPVVTLPGLLPLPVLQVATPPPFVRVDLA